MKKPSPLPVWVLSLGCAKNRVDTERLLGQLGNVRPVQSIGRSKLALINTCGFIEPAVRESVRAILDAAAEIADNKRRPLLAVAGCMVGRYGMRELAKEMPEVDLWLPTEKMLLWPQMLQQALGRSSEQAGSRIISTPRGGRYIMQEAGASFVKATGAAANTSGNCLHFRLFRQFARGISGKPAFPSAGRLG